MNAVILSLATFATLQLHDALQLLDQQNQTLVQARARAAEASGIARQVLAGSLPQLAVTGGYTRNNAEARANLGQLAAILLPPGAPAQADLIIQPLAVWNVTGAARVPLFMPSQWADFAAALSSTDAARESVQHTRQQLRFALIQAGWMGAAATEIVAASERALQNAVEHATSAKRAVAAGTGTSLAVLQAETERVRRESDLAQARAEEARLRLTTGVLLGRVEDVQIIMPAHIEASADIGRADVRAADAQLQAADRQVTSAWLRHAPQLVASGAAFKQTVPFPTGRDDGWRVTLELSWTLYDGGFRYGKLRQAEAQRAAADASATQLRLQTKQEEEDGKRQLALARERLRLADEQQKLALEAAANANRGFAAGVASALDVRDANDRLYQAEVSVANGKARLGTAEAALALALGKQ